MEFAHAGGDVAAVGGLDAAAGDFPEEGPGVVGCAPEEEDLAVGVCDEGAADEGVDVRVLEEELGGRCKEGGEGGVGFV